MLTNEWKSIAHVLKKAFGCQLSSYDEIKQLQRCLFSFDFFLTQFLFHLFRNFFFLFDLLYRCQANEHSSQFTFNDRSTNMTPFQITVLVALLSEMLTTLHCYLQQFFVIPITSSEHVNIRHHKHIRTINLSNMRFYSINVLPSRCFVFQIFQATG